MINNNDRNLLSTSILEEKKSRKLTWDQLAENLPIAGNSLRMSFKRNNVKFEILERLCKDLGIDVSEHLKVLREQRNEQYIHSCLIGRFESDFYKENYDQERYINALPTYLWRRKSVKNQPDNSQYRTFEIRSNEMNDASYRSLLLGDFVLCKVIPRNKLRSTLKVDALIGFLHWDQGIKFRLLKDFDWKKKTIRIVALSDPTSLQEISISECAEFYEILQLDRQTKF